ncbi:hypothetical protein [Planotetraspora kaengkrachanensis]|uniref:Uncharacterized protein n=1 Tax=Planotetraspora kaengkrachanensis TaxID=575193 RepID=A0A8J3V6W5_9ACTN|nr:hypothetical protein [Planotetraspora kaengkrachanensis]GIG81865.1 hypothetical protein Pka01_49920 [Planotetraspora kaengkrachanensis]
MAKLDGMDPKLVREMLAGLQRAAKRLDTLDARIAQLTRGAGVAVQATHHPSEVADACRGMVKDVTDRLALLEKQERQRRQGGHESLMTVVSTPAPRRVVTDDGPREKESAKDRGPGSGHVTRPPAGREPARPKPKRDPTRLGSPGDGVRGGAQPGDAKPGDSKPGDQKPVDSKPGDLKPGEAKPGDLKPGDLKPGDLKPGDAKPGEAKPGGCLPQDSRPGEHDGAQSGLSGTPHGRVSDPGKHRRRPHTGPGRSPHGDATHDPRFHRPVSPDRAGTPGGPGAPYPADPRSGAVAADAAAVADLGAAAAFDPSAAARPPAATREPYLVLGSPVPDGALDVPGDLGRPAPAGADPRMSAAAGIWQDIPLPSAVQPVDVVSYPTGRSGDDTLWVVVDRRRETAPFQIPGVTLPEATPPEGGRWAPGTAASHGDRPLPEGCAGAQAEQPGDPLQPTGRHSRPEPYGQEGQGGSYGGGRHRSPGPADGQGRPWDGRL